MALKATGTHNTQNRSNMAESLERYLQSKMQKQILGRPNY